MQLARAVNRALKGQLDCTFPVTLTPNASRTVISDARISSWTSVHASPTSASAAAEQAGGTMWFACTGGAVTVHHANSAVTDRTFQFSLLG